MARIWISPCIKKDKFNWNFTVENIERKSKRSKLVLNWDGKEAEIDNSGVREIKIPSKDEFVVMDVEVIHSPTQMVRIHFSDPLSNTQMLNGLIYLENTDVTLVKDDQVVNLYPTERRTGLDYVQVENFIQNINGDELSSAPEFKIFFEDESGIGFKTHATNRICSIYKTIMIRC